MDTMELAELFRKSLVEHKEHLLQFQIVTKATHNLQNRVENLEKKNEIKM